MNLRSGSAVGQGVLLKASRAQFEEGVELIFSKWTALQLAVDQEWGGRGSKTKAEDMLDEVIDWFYRKKSALVANPLRACMRAHISRRQLHPQRTE